jgi:D-alanyl-D-alanine carboxypeptidase
MKTRICTLILLLSLSFSSVIPQNINKQKLDSLFAILAEKNKAMGSLAISKNGKILYTKVIGYSFISETDKKAATTLTKYRIGSITKMFTATMIFQLVEEGKIKLNTTLDTYFPEIPNATKITIGNMLYHRSGLHNLTDDPEYMGYMTKPKTEAEMVAIIAKYKVDFEPDVKTSYSNSNYILLGYILEKITKQPYSVILKSRITNKAGLNDTYVGKKTSLTENECYSYKFNNKWIQEPETDMSIPGGAGAIVSTPTDLTKFIEALFTKKLVSQNSLDQMKTLKDGMGMGMFQFPFNNRKAYGHNGGIDGFGSNLAYFPDDSLAISYCTNGMVYGMNDILIGVLSACYNVDYTIPVFRNITLKPEELDKYTGVYSSTQIPLKITVSKNDNVLNAQATGQSAFPLSPFDTDKFSFDQAGIKMEFNPLKNEMTLKQGGATFLFTREK